MAETPPAQVTANVSTPPTPLHGAVYDRLEATSARYSTRSSQRRTHHDSHSTPRPEPTPNTAHTPRTLGTPGSSRRKSSQSQLGPQSPQPSPKSRSTRRVQVVSPTSPDHPPSVPKATTSSNSHLSILSSTTTMGDGMMPTPVKTPKKKTIPHINAAARALFQEEPVIGEGISPRRARKGRRYNGFTLESFTAEDGNDNGRIQIFTDSRDRVPQAETQETNPFLEKPHMVNGSSTQKAARTSKRRKLSGERKRDPQVQEAIDRDEGMVYVFRGKKVYRRFDDIDDEEEDIDTDDLGLFEHTTSGTRMTRPIKTLTRKSIKPKRLFQTEQQQLDREHEKEEEVTTEIEDSPAPEQSNEPLSHDHSLRSTDKKEGVKAANRTNAPVTRKTKTHQTKKGSPFDQWKRTKTGTASTSGAATKGKKRAAPDTETSEAVATKRSRGD